MNTTEVTSKDIVNLIEKKLQNMTPLDSIKSQAMHPKVSIGTGGFRVSPFNIAEFLEQKLEDEDLVQIVEYYSQEKPHGLFVYESTSGKKYAIGKQHKNHTEEEHPLRLSYYVKKSPLWAGYISAQAWAEEIYEESDEKRGWVISDLETQLRASLEIIKLAEQLSQTDLDGTKKAVDYLKEGYLVKL